MKQTFVNSILCVIVTLLAFGISAQAEEKIYTLPEVFEGTQDGSADGNPYLENEKPLWRADQVWPENIYTPANYKAMPWVGSQWKSTTVEFGGQPSAKFTASNVVLSVRGTWGGEPPQGGAKVAALVFIAPLDKTFTVNGTFSAEIWQGEDPVVLNVIKFSKADQKMIPLKKFSLTKGGAARPFESITAELKAGDEIIFVPSPPAGYNAANIAINGLEIK